MVAAETLRRYGKAVFLIAVIAVVTFFVLYTDRMVKDLSEQERQRMEIWADATKEIVGYSTATDVFDGELGETAGNIDFVLGILERNNTIPVLLTDDDGNILQFRNFTLPDSQDAVEPSALTDADMEFLSSRLEKMRHTPNVIHINVAPGVMQHLYYEDSITLRRLSYYPYALIAVMLVFIAVVYFAVLSTKRAEQNKVWVGLSKETAHQLGTPISSLMAWLELLPAMGVDDATVKEMDKDVRRLGTIASRFSKIGSYPALSPTDIGKVASSMSDYMSLRVSRRIALDCHIDEGVPEVMASAPLIEWVIENLVKNAVDSMDSGEGKIDVDVMPWRGGVAVEVTDNGRGMTRATAKNIFNPGFTTKKRGWGLGLTLARRIVEEYHGGKIFVKSTVPGHGTMFRIELPRKKS